MSTAQVPRSEHPRPQFRRNDWLCLNGRWTCRIDPLGEESDAKGTRGLETEITVPFAPESRLSGVHHTGFIESLWYHRSLVLPEGWAGRRVLLHFGAVDWQARIFLDGEQLATHWGGSTGFTVDLGARLQPGHRHDLVVHVRDRTRSAEQPCGKQSHEPHSFGCYYTRTTGIWQSVWLEAAGEAHLEGVEITPCLENARLLLVPRIRGRAAGIEVTARLGERRVGYVRGPARTGLPLVLDLDEVAPWAPEHPSLYDLDIQLVDDRGETLDHVASYAGLRSVAVAGDRFLLNGEARYLRLVLDQGFYPDGVWTAPSDQALQHDIETAMAMGFNGARLHQKVFEPRYHYWADRLGYLTWAESPSWGFDVDASTGARNFLVEWSAIVEQCRNYPSIIVWTPLNETGHRLGRGESRISELHERLVRDAAALTRRLDATRPVNDASGWVHQDTDLWTSHSYEQDAAALRGLLTPPPDIFRNAPASEPAYAGQPFILDECGGAAWAGDATTFAQRGTVGERGANTLSSDWGYGAAPKSADEFEARLRGLIDTLLSVPFVRGYCYTQLTDVEQERNGLLTFERAPKLPIETYRTIFDRDPA